MFESMHDFSDTRATWRKALQGMDSEIAGSKTRASGNSKSGDQLPSGISVGSTTSESNWLEVAQL
jgi:hypothetical protein